MYGECESRVITGRRVHTERLELYFGSGGRRRAEGSEGFHFGQNRVKREMVELALSLTVRFDCDREGNNGQAMRRQFLTTEISTLSMHNAKCLSKAKCYYLTMVQ